MRDILITQSNDTDTRTPSVLGEHIRRLRKAQEKTLREFADNIDIGYPLLSKIENGRIEPDTETLHKIARALLSKGAFEAFRDCAECPVICLHDHWYSDAVEIAELLPFGFIQQDTGSVKWYIVTEAGYVFAEWCGVSVWRWPGVA